MSTDASVGGFLRFGIPDVDELLGQATGQQQHGFYYERSQPTSICLVGPDGSGKSVLGMHLAARYLADNPGARVIYLSVDLNFNRARLAWVNFGLDRLKKRDEALYGALENDPRRKLNAPSSLDSIDLIEVGKFQPPEGKPLLLEHILAGAGKCDANCVYFYDVATSHAGDLWQEVTRLAALIRTSVGKGPDPLLIIDSVDNLERAAGPVDIFGSREPRGGKISRLLDIAKQTCHICLVVGADSADERPQEVYLTDCVVRLNVETVAGYSVRNIEIEKARGQAHVRGTHHLSIRSGRGSSTGRMENPDDRRVEAGGKTTSYLRVFHSLDYLDSRGRHEEDNERQEPGSTTVDFTGIEYLDDLIGGLRPGSVNAIVGEGKTLKSNLARAFLSRAIGEFVGTMSASTPYRTQSSTLPGQDRQASEVGFAVLLTTDDLRPEELARRIYEWCFGESARDKHLGTLEMLESSLICRRFETHSLFSSSFMNIVRSSIQEARRILGISGSNSIRTRAASGRIRLVIDDWNTIQSMYPQLREDSRFLEFLIRDLRDFGVTSLIVDSEPVLGSHLGSEVRRSLLLNETENLIFTWPVISRGRRIVAVCSGDTRTSSQPTRIRQIRRVEKPPNTDRVLVDPVLELYRALLRGETEPEPVPLRVLLLDEEHAGSKSLASIRRMFDELFTPAPGFPHVIDLIDGELPLSVRYEHARALAYFKTLALDHTLVMLLDEFWGSGKHESVTDLRDFLCDDVASEKVDDGGLKSIRDPHDLYRRWERGDKPWPRWRFFLSDLFPDLHRLIEPEPASQTNRTASGVPPQSPGQTSRIATGVPYSWDFAFVLCRHRAWANARLREVAGPKPPGTNKRVTVGDVWRAFGADEQWSLHPGGKSTESLVKEGKLSTSAIPYGGLTNDEFKNLEAGALFDLRSWRWFLSAAATVAASDDHFSSKEICALGLASAGPESLASLVLEVWLSEIMRTLVAPGGGAPSQFVQWFQALFAPDAPGGSASRPPGLFDLLIGGMNSLNSETLRDAFTHEKANGPAADMRAARDAKLKDIQSYGFAAELYKAIRLLFDPLYDSGMIARLEKDPDATIQAPAGAVAVRHSYKTASRSASGFDALDPYVPLRLPGYCTTRGDLYLAIARGSRSERLGWWAIDKLVSVRSNLERLEDGVGLPPRHLGSELCTKLATALKSVRLGDEHEGIVGGEFPAYYERRLTYDELLKLCPTFGKRSAGNSAADLQFLFRSRIKGYAGQSLIWRQWVREVLLEMAALRRSRGAVWLDAFTAYDSVEEWQRQVREGKRTPTSRARGADGGSTGREKLKARLRQDPSLMAIATSWERFGEQCARLLEQLRASSPPDP